MIDYQKIADAVEHYETIHGYRQINVPWIVSDIASDITRPYADSNDISGFRPREYNTFSGRLVASGEQSFLDLMLGNSLPKGKYMCVTPCFRDEFTTYLNVEYFIKVELINTATVNLENLWDMTNAAMDYFQMYDPQAEIVENKEYDRLAVGPSYDILSQDGVELGSYGIRKYGDLRWIYGTACAEPRLSRAIKVRLNKEANNGG